MSGTVRGAATFIAIIIGAGSYLSAGTQLPVRNVQLAVIGEIYKALTYFISPISSLMGEQIVINGGTFTISSGAGFWPILILVLGGAVAGLLARSMGGAIAASFIGSSFIFVGWQLIGLQLIPVLSPNHAWMLELDRIYTMMLYLRPLEIPALFGFPIISSIAISIFTEEEKAQSARRHEPLFSWRS
ncbi:MAG: hypothetical protein QW102_02635 [Candidatus Nezhaarchaeales archaeon]